MHHLISQGHAFTFDDAGNIMYGLDKDVNKLLDVESMSLEGSTYLTRKDYLPQHLKNVSMQKVRLEIYEYLQFYRTW